MCGMQSKNSRLSIGVFGSFYPHLNRLSTVNTGLVSLLAIDRRVGRVMVYAPMGSRLPPGIGQSAVEVRSVWNYDDPVSMIRTWLEMLAASSRTDAFVFNIFLTSFGKSKVANAFGLVIPVLVGLTSRVTTITYMHNFLETQRVEELGYNPSWLARFLVSQLERLIGLTTQLVAPISSQATIVEATLRVDCKPCFIPYLEALPLESIGVVGPAAVRTRSTGRRTVLLFGAWGPQKDIAGSARVLAEVMRRNTTIDVVIAGSINESFPEYGRKLRDSLADLPSNRVQIQLNLPQIQVGQLFQSADVVLLPYMASGGYSGVMSVAALLDVPLVSYDHPQLRESAAELGARVTFVRSGDVEGFAQAVLAAVSADSQASDTLSLRMGERIEVARSAVGRLIDLMTRT